MYFDIREHLAIIMDNIRNSLSVSCRTRSTAVYPVVYVGEFVCNTIGLLTTLRFSETGSTLDTTHNIASHRCSTVGANDHTTIELHGHD